MRLQYGGVSVLLGGDLNSAAEVFLMEHHSALGIEWPWTPDEERRIVDGCAAVFGADVAKACHHGSADFTDSFLRTVHPAATVISSGDEESHAHPRSDTLGAIGMHGRGWRPLIFSTELSRSTREDEGDARERLGRIAEQLRRDPDPARRADLLSRRDVILDALAKRNVTTYGAINLRSNGEKAVLAYMLERPRRSGGKLTRWDVYQLERQGPGPIAYVPK
jgi:hypothetical protein